MNLRISAMFCALGAFSTANAVQFDLAGPAGSGRFGTDVLLLPNGNIVVSDPSADVPFTDAGAVHLYSPSLQLISTVTGASPGDRVGHHIHMLTNGNVVVASYQFDRGGAVDAGAVTWINATTGLSGVVSAANSLVGASSGDQLGGFIVTVLTNGNYVVQSLYVDDGNVIDAGAVTWGNGSTGTTGIASRANSLMGSKREDFFFVDVEPLSNGNYVVCANNWDNGVAINAGAATFGGPTGVSGLVSQANSLVGTQSLQRLCGQGIVSLANGNYVVVSEKWDSATAADVGAVTWGDGNSGTTGVVSVANSIIGDFANDGIGVAGVFPLSNGHYVIASPQWHSSTGAATWVNGSGPANGLVSVLNSLTGSTPGDYVAGSGVTALSNGNYVVASRSWSENKGAASWGNGNLGTAGQVSAANSYVGTIRLEFFGSYARALSNGHYVVGSPFWRNDGIRVGAATWGNGLTGSVGSVSSANSLIGTADGNAVGTSITPLSNGHYVVGSAGFNNAGAVTWVDGTIAFSGVMSAANSLIGTTADDRVGTAHDFSQAAPGIKPLTDGNYVVRSSYWDRGAVMNAGALTWRTGSAVSPGIVSESNSLVGSTANDFMTGGANLLTSDGSVIYCHQEYDNGGAVDAGACTFMHGSMSTGPLTDENSVIGTVGAGLGAGVKVAAYDEAGRRMFVGRPSSNIVTVMNLAVLFRSGFE